MNDVAEAVGHSWQESSLQTKLSQLPAALAALRASMTHQHGTACLGLKEATPMRLLSSPSYQSSSGVP
eukprot:3938776-Rhodomonas_salina.11